MERDDYKAEVLGRLLTNISNLSLPQMEQLIHSLEQWEQAKATDENASQFFEKREHFRKDAPVYGIFETKNDQFRDYTKNVSVGGVLIDPETTLSLQEELFMTFFSNSLDHPIRTNGKVVRINSDGIGIQFNKVVPPMSSV